MPRFLRLLASQVYTLPESPLHTADASVDNFEAVTDHVTQEPSAIAEASEEALFAELLDDVDQDLLSILINEARQEVQQIQGQLGIWLSDHTNTDSLTQVRRAFHTIKGNARLIGAKVLGDFSEAFEKLVETLTKTIPADQDSVGQLLAEGVMALEELIGQFETGVAPETDITALLVRVQAELSGDDYDHPSQAEETAPVMQTSQPRPVTEAEVEQSVAELDPVLFDIFRQEAESHIETILELTNKALEGNGTLKVTDELIRAVHTLTGSARTAQVKPMAEIGGLMHRFVEQNRQLGLVLTPGGTEKIRAGALAAQAMLQALENKKALPEYAELRRDIHTLIGDLSSSTLTVEVPQVLTEEAESEPLELALDDHAEEDQPPSLSEVDVHEAEEAEAEDDLSLLDLSDAQFADADAEVDAEVDADAEVEEQAYSAESETDFLSQREEPPAIIETTPRKGQPGPAISFKDISEYVIDPSEYDQPTEQDDELVSIFLEEGEELLDACESAMGQWNDDHDSKEALMELQRSLHTLKGGSRMAGLNNIGNLTHVVESLVIDIADGRVPFAPQMLDLVQACFDRVHNMLANVKERTPVPPAKDLLDQLEFTREHPEEAFNTSSGPAAVVEVKPKHSTLTHDEQLEVDQPETVEEEFTLPKAVAKQAEPQLEKQQPAANSQEMVRIRQDMLDNLVNYAGEVSIYHGRLEQQINTFGMNLNELDQTVRRLRGQLRELEIEIESQVRFTHEKEASEAGRKHEDFDPLEMDRYTAVQERSRSIAETVSDLQSIQGLMGDMVKEAETLLIQQARISTDLQDGLMRTRMVQFGGLGPRLRRIVRQTSQELGKQAQLHFHGMENELDRTVLEHMIAPLEHMLRNAVAHGLEVPADRIISGKNEMGNITISVRSEGSDVVIMVEDDGRGIDVDAIREKAITIGMLNPSASVSDQELMQFILEPGFTTAKTVSQIAGRGVGMDVVHSEIKQLGGFLRIDSVVGQGTTFMIRLPYTLAINKAILANVAEDVFAIPLGNMEGLVRVSNEQLKALYEQDDPSYEYAGNKYRLHYLGQILGISNPVLEGRGVMRPLLMMRAAGERVAIQADAIQGNREIFIKPVGAQISKVRGLAGATILGDGRVVFVLDVSELIMHGQVITRVVKEDVAALAAAQVAKQSPTIMVVDDSITIRKVTTRMLSRYNYNTISAKDGVDALGVLQDHLPDAMLLDIEMPRMDGFELATHIRNDERLKHIPIIMITSRTGDKHRNRALEIGVNHYLGKPYQENDLLEKIQEVTGVKVTKVEE